MLEESGVEVADAGYVASQPWPFPSSLMIGFSARAVAGDPHPGDEELSEVRWFERPEVEAAAAGTSDIALSPRLLDLQAPDRRVARYSARSG